MASDAHAHPYDLARLESDAETERRLLGIACAASAWHEEEFLFNERLAAAAVSDGAPPVVLCFGVHPQLPAAKGETDGPNATAASLAFLRSLVAANRLAAIGEAGFDLFHGPGEDGFRETEPLQDDLFRAQLDLAMGARLPMVLHLRRAMHKVFAYDRELSALPAVIFHSYSGTLREAEALLQHGVNAYFSFGTVICLNHKRAMEACAVLPAERLLLETDAPYQPLRGAGLSSWRDISSVIAAAARLRAASGLPKADPEELEATVDQNFRRAYGIS